MSLLLEFQVWFCLFTEETMEEEKKKKENWNNIFFTDLDSCRMKIGWVHIFFLLWTNK